MIHPAGSGGDRREGADDWYEVSDQHGLGAVFLVKLLSAGDVLFPEDKAIFFEQLWAEVFADQIADVITKDGGQGYAGHDGGDRHFATGSEDTGGEEQGIAWEKEADHHAGFSEDDQAYQEQATGLDKVINVKHQAQV
jgi:hypothetical protein